MTQWPPDESLWTALTGTLGRTRAHVAGMRCITSWDELRSRLGEPKTLLCLGNGPSSEGSGLDRVGFDCLFRVNWIWNDRSVHRDPNVVFTADLDAPSGPSVPIICFPTREDANRILASYVRPPRVDVKIPRRAIQALGAQHDQVIAVAVGSGGLCVAHVSVCRMMAVFTIQPGEHQCPA